MSKAVLASILPWWCLEMARGNKTVEVRKNKPNLPTPFKVYIYVPKKRPILAWGDVFRGSWETEFTTITGRSFDEASKIWDIFNGKVMGEFVCDKIYKFSTRVYLGEEQEITDEEIVAKSCVSRSELRKYEGQKQGIYGWHISDLDVYDSPQSLSIFHRPCPESLYCESCAMYREREMRCGNAALQITRPPQSWCYVEEII